MTTKGVRLVSAVTWSTSPTQKIKVIAMMKPRIALVANAVNNEKGIVLEASFAFSAKQKVRLPGSPKHKQANRVERTHVYRAVISNEDTPRCKNTNEGRSSRRSPHATVGESEKDV